MQEKESQLIKSFGRRIEESKEKEAEDRLNSALCELIGWALLCGVLLAQVCIVVGFCVA